MGVQILKFSSYTQLIIWRLRDGKKTLIIYINLYLLSIKILRVSHNKSNKTCTVCLIKRLVKIWAVSPYANLLKEFYHEFFFIFSAGSGTVETSSQFSPQWKHTVCTFYVISMFFVGLFSAICLSHVVK